MDIVQKLVEIKEVFLRMFTFNVLFYAVILFIQKNNNQIHITAKVSHQGFLN